MTRMSWLRELKLALLLAGGTVCVFLTILLCFMAYVIFTMNLLPISNGELSVLVPGTTTQAEAVEKFGKPKYDSWGERDGLMLRKLGYQRPGSWPIVYLVFDENGRFVRHTVDYSP